MPEFSALLDVPLKDIERPKPIPVGTYTVIMTEMPKQGKYSTGTPFLRFVLHVVAAGPDVHEQSLLNSLTKPSGETVPLSSKVIYQNFGLTEDAMPFLKDFLVGTGIKGKSSNEIIGNLLNQEFKVYVIHDVPRTGGSDRIFPKVQRSMPA